MIFGLGNRQKMKEDMFLINLGTVALHAAKVPTNVFSSTLICILTLDYSIPPRSRISKRGSRNFSSGLAVEGGGGVQTRLTKKSSDVVFSLLFSVSPQLILQRESSDHGFFKKNYY